MTKVRLMTADASPALTDLFYMVIDPATTPADRKVVGTAIATMLAAAPAFAAVFATLVNSATNVKSPAYGAVGDDSNDDTAAITAAIAAGDATVIPAGTYKTTGSITPPVGHCLIFEPGATLHPVGNFTPILLSGKVVAPRYLGVTIDMSDLTTVGADNAAILFRDNSAVADGVTITEVGAGVRGIGNFVGVGGQSKSGRSLFCRVSCQTGVLPNVGIGANNWQGATTTLYDYDVIGCLVDYEDADPAIDKAGINLFCEPGYSIRDSKIHGNTVRMPREPTDATFRGVCISYRRAPGVEVIGNHTAYGSMGVSNDGSDGATIQGNVIFGPTYAGIENVGSEDGDISGNIIDGDGLAECGIVLGGAACRRTKVRGNTLINGLTISPGAALRLSDVATGSVISANTIDGTWFSKWEPATFGGDVVLSGNPGIDDQIDASLLFNANEALRWPDPAGVSRRIALVAASGTIYLGDIDNTYNAPVLICAGGNQATHFLVNGVEQLVVDDSVAAVNGDLRVATVGYGVRVKEGSNATMGVATLVAGAVVVSTTKVTANSRIMLMVQALGTVTVPKPIAVTARTAATSFTITSADATDTSVVAWVIIEPAP